MTAINVFLKTFPPETNDWTGKVTFSFGYPRHGWLQLAITCSAHVQGLIIELSGLFDPFKSFIHWLDQIVAGDLPARFHINEEGPGKVLRALPVDEDEFLFQIAEWGWQESWGIEEPLFMYVQVSKKQFLSEFLKQWDDFMLHKYDPAHWDDIGNDLTRLDVSRIRRFVEG